MQRGKVKQQILKTKLALLNKGVHTIRAHFDGGGDDGSITDIEYLDPDGNCISDYKGCEPFVTTDDIEELTYHFFENYVNRVGDWVNNEGGWGLIDISLSDLTYTIDYYQRTYEEYDDAGTLLNNI